ncbi:MAG: hypothetical protein CL613_08445 [Aquimarina sp.]|nr:hypothetical protein [Aquimarina sp.]
MKKLLLTLFISFSCLSVFAQQETEKNTYVENEQKTQTTKYDFYKTLVAVNNFDIKIKEDKKVALRTKEDFYNALMDRNGFKIDNKKKTRLADHINKEEKLTKDSTQVTGL